MKISEKFFRTHIVNITIAIMLVALLSLTLISQTTQVFSSNSYSPYYSGNKENKNVSLMFNVYMGSEYIDGILEVLKENDVYGTFFVGGCWVAKNNECLENIYGHGHEIGNHGYWHKDHKLISEEQNKSEMTLTHTLVSGLIGYDIKLFAPPSGSYSQTTLKVAQSLGYKTIMWSKDTIDWRDHDSSLIYTRATSKPSGGDLILMHPTKETLDALPKIISFYLDNGYKLTTVSENIS